MECLWPCRFGLAFFSSVEMREMKRALNSVRSVAQPRSPPQECVRTGSVRANNTAMRTSQPIDSNFEIVRQAEKLAFA
jgi:hypothetical protein